MNNPLDQIGDTFSVDLPKAQSLDDLLDAVLKEVRQYGEDLREQKFYSVPGGKPWLEITDNPEHQEAVLHFFNDQNEYLQSVDGNVSKGRWRLLDTTNKIIIEQGGDRDRPAKSELFELAFLNANFFILKKHGTESSKPGKRKYLFMGHERAVRGLKWTDAVELLFDEYRSDWGLFQWMVILAVVAGAIVLLFSVL